MALPTAQLRYTVEQYLTIERATEDRHEYLDGQIYAMAGESLAHGDICTNLVRIVSTQLLGNPCRVLSRDMKVRSGPDPRPRQTKKGLFSYPDLVVVCGEPQFHDEHRDVILNPTIIIEVLSESTEAVDRGEKFLRYQLWNPTLAEYLLVTQTSPLIEQYVRQSDGSWSWYFYQGLEESLSIKTIDCTLQLADVYDRVTFPEEPRETLEEETA